MVKKIKIVLEASGPTPTSDNTIATRPLLVEDTHLVQNKIDYELLKHRMPGRKSHQHLLYGQNEYVSVIARNFGAQSAPTRMYNYAVLVLDPDEGKAQIYDPELFIPESSVKALESLPAESDQDFHGLTSSISSNHSSTSISRSSTPVDYKMAKTLLGESFGTKKTKQAIHSMEKNQINLVQLEHASKGFINRTIDQTLDRLQSETTKSKDSPSIITNEPLPNGSSSTTTSNSSSEGNEILPRFNSKTTKVEEIYLFHNVLPTMPRCELEPEVNSIISTGTATDSIGEWKAGFKSQYHNMNDWILDRIILSITMPQASQDHHSKTKLDMQQQLSMLLYMHHLICFKNLSEGVLNSEVGRTKGLPGATIPLIDYLLQTFAESISLGPASKRRYKFSQIGRDRLISHICICALLLEQFRLNLTIFSATVLQLPLLKMTDYFKAVGCVIEKPDKGDPTTFTPGQGGRKSLQVKFARLVAPIVFPKLRKGSSFR